MNPFVDSEGLDLRFGGLEPPTFAMLPSFTFLVSPDGFEPSTFRM